MKTLEEVKTHVDKVGYNQLAIQKIEGFLLGNGLLGDEFEMEYMIGERTFDDFRTWFNSEEEKKQEIDWSEFGFGDFIHVQDGIDVVLLGGIYDETFVCFDGQVVMCLSVTDETRPCNEEEISSIDSLLNVLRVKFCFEKNEFVPSCVCNGCANRNFDSGLIDELEINAKDAIENIIANVYGGSMNEEEQTRVVDALKVLVELGKMYE